MVEAAPHPIYGSWTTVAVKEVDEEAEAAAAAQLKAVLHAHATGKRLMTGGADTGAWSGAEARAMGKAAAEGMDEEALATLDDPDPVDAFSTHNPYGGAYKGINLDAADRAVKVESGAAAESAARLVLTGGDEDGATAEFKKRKRPAGVKPRKVGKQGHGE